MTIYTREKFYQDCNECEKPIHYGFWTWYPEFNAGLNLCPECAKDESETSYPKKFTFTNYRREGRWAEEWD